MRCICCNKILNNNDVVFIAKRNTEDTCISCAEIIKKSIDVDCAKKDNDIARLKSSKVKVFTKEEIEKYQRGEI